MLKKGVAAGRQLSRRCLDNNHYQHRFETLHYYTLNPAVSVLRLLLYGPFHRRLYQSTSAAGDEEPVAEQVTGEEQTSEEAFPQTQAFLVQREAQVHQLAYGSQ